LNSRPSKTETFARRVIGKKWRAREREREKERVWALLTITKTTGRRERAEKKVCAVNDQQKRKIRVERMKGVTYVTNGGVFYELCSIDSQQLQQRTVMNDNN